MMAMKVAGGGGGGGGGGGADNTGAELAYKARMAELDQRKEEFAQQMGQTRLEWNTGQERLAERRDLFKKGGNRQKDQGEAAGQAGGGAYQKRQETALAGTEGGTPVTGHASEAFNRAATRPNAYAVEEAVAMRTMEIQKANEMAKEE